MWLETSVDSGGGTVVLGSSRSEVWKPIEFTPMCVVDVSSIDKACGIRVKKERARVEAEHLWKLQGRDGDNGTGGTSMGLRWLGA